VCVCVCVCVSVPATIVNSDVVDVVEVIENDTAYLLCPAQGTPAPSILWLRDNTPLLVLTDDDGDGDEVMESAVSLSGRVRELSAGRQLELRQVRVSDEAMYQCQATNVAGQRHKTFSLRVLGTQSITHAQTGECARGAWGSYPQWLHDSPQLTIL